MEFGKATTPELDQIDFKLPADTARTTQVLKDSGVKKAAIHVGCAKWGRPDWIGKIYPKGTRSTNFLDEYAKQFNCIEFNAIYYKLPSHDQIRAWKNKVGKDFKFCPKFTDVITHIKRLKDTQREVDLFLDVVHELGDQLGPVFLMPHPQMGPKDAEIIQQFVSGLPKDIEVFVELRHPQWFENNAHTKLFDFLQHEKRGTVITDSAGRRDCVHMDLTTPDAFIRFVGNSLHRTDYERVDEWVQRIKKWMESGLRSCYFFMHQHEELYSPELSKYLIEQLNKECKLDIRVPQFVTDTAPLSLF